MGREQTLKVFKTNTCSLLIRTCRDLSAHNSQSVLGDEFTSLPPSPCSGLSVWFTSQLHLTRLPPWLLLISLPAVFPHCLARITQTSQNTPRWLRAAKQDKAGEILPCPSRPEFCGVEGHIADSSASVSRQWSQFRLALAQRSSDLIIWLS